MANRHEAFQVTCPANTPPASPVEVSTAFLDGICRTVEIRWPRGHSSLTGIRVACAHQQLVPFTQGAWVLGDAAERTYEITDPPQSGQWSCYLYNTDNRAHYWQVVYEVYAYPRRQAVNRAAVQPLAVGDIYNALV